MIGKTISHYKILEKLGSGGMGVVYKAEDTKLKRTVALKFLPPEWTRDTHAKKRFLHEAQAASALDHSNICNVHEINETEDGQSYIVMACYDGETLKEKLTHGPLLLREVVDIASQIAKGLEKAHKIGIVHRDINPANIFITKEGIVKIVDFGLAKLSGQSRTTQAGTTPGTVAYMSPEQTRGDKVDQRTDIWSLGVVIYEMITGQRPFKGDYDQAIIYSILNEEPEMISRHSPDFPASLQRLVSKCLIKDLGARFHETSKILTELNRITKDLQKSEKTKKQILRILKPITIILLLIIGILLSGRFLMQKIIPPPRISVMLASLDNLTDNNELEFLRNAIPALLVTSLEQSDRLDVYTAERVSYLLKQENMPDSGIVNINQARELCSKHGIKILIAGDLTTSVSDIIINIQINNVKNNQMILVTQSQGQGISSILEKQIDELSCSILASLNIIPKNSNINHMNPIAEMVTGSMLAYNNYILGKKYLHKHNKETAGEYFKKAMELDSNFIAAHHQMLLLIPSDYFKKITNFERHIQNMSLKERLYVEADYAFYIERDWEERVCILKKIIKKFPNEKQARMNLAFHHSKNQDKINEYKKVLEIDPTDGEALQSLALCYMNESDFNTATRYVDDCIRYNPDYPNIYDTLGDIYFHQGRLDAANEQFLKVMEKNDDEIYTCWKIGYIHALNEEYTKAQEWFERYLSIKMHWRYELEAYFWSGFYYAWLGQFSKSEQYFKSAYKIIKPKGLFHETNALYYQACIYYDKSDYKLSRTLFEEFLETIKNCRKKMPDFWPECHADYNFWLGLMAIKESRIDSARTMLKKFKQFKSKLNYDKSYPQLENRLSLYYHVLKGEIFLAVGDIDKALDEGKKIVPMELYHKPHGIIPLPLIKYNLPVPMDLVARAYILKGDLDGAISEYERLIIDKQKSYVKSLINPAYHYELARLFDRKGLIASAKQQYEKYLEIFQNADDQVGHVKAAKLRLAQIAQR